MKTLGERFWGYVRKGSAGDCWEWTGYKDADGYGRIKINGRFRGAHRVALAFATGGERNGLHALHSCDNPACVNAAHLRWGTHRENVSDRNSRSRQAKGERNGRSKLTAEQARQIRVMPGSLRQIGRLFGIDSTIVGEIKRGERWRHA